MGWCGQKNITMMAILFFKFRYFWLLYQLELTYGSVFYPIQAKYISIFR